MRQVPTSLIIGSGRMAKHMQRYLELLALPYRSWSRQANTPAELLADSISCPSILLLIKDTAIAEFLEQYPFLKGKKLIHFSGSLTLPGVYGAHPLMTFIPELYSLETYQKIPFILGETSPPLTELLPGLLNPFYHIPDAERSYYHALCVLSGNFTAMLWQKFFKEIDGRFQIPQEMTYPYLQQVMTNLMSGSQAVLTGPLVRGDQATISANLKALDDDEFQKVYQAFVEAYQSIKR